MKGIMVWIFYWCVTNYPKFSDLKHIHYLTVSVRSRVWAQLRWALYSRAHKAAIPLLVRAVFLSGAQGPLPGSHGSWQNSVPFGCMTESGPLTGCHHKNGAPIDLFSELPSRGIGNESTHMGGRSRVNCYHSSCSLCSSVLVDI